MRLLVVEDEVALATTLAAGLRRDGYAVDIAHAGDIAAQFLSVDRYDLVTLDLTLPLPGPDGLELARRIRAGEFGAAQTRVLMVTARDAVTDRVAGLDFGADDYLVKPFSLDELRARVRSLLRRPVSAGSAVMTLGPLKVDTGRLDASWAGRGLSLTPKEFSVLRYLLGHVGMVVSQEELLEHVWDRHADPFTDTVRVTVGTLRRKLMEHSSETPIETVVGCGYRLRDDL